MAAKSQSFRHSKKPQWHLRQIILTAILAIMSMPTFGQTYISQSSGMYGTITRSNDAGNKRYHYVKTGPTSGKFLWGLTFGTGNPNFSFCNITGYDIKDFTVFNDTVFFCGNDANGVGFYGWVKPALQWTFHIYRLYTSDTRITNVTRIKAFRSEQYMNILLIGTYHSSDSHQYRSLLHVKNFTTCTLAYGDPNYFEDVALLDDYVVTVSRKKTRQYPHEPRYLRVLNRSQFSLYDPLFDYYSAAMNSQSSLVIESVGDVRLQPVGGNRFVSVYYNDSAYYFDAYTVASDILNLHKYYTVPTGTLPNIGDVAYNQSDNTLAILHNIDTVGTAAFYDCSLFPNISLSGAWTPFIALTIPLTHTKLLSVTKRPSSKFVITGITGNKAVFWNTANTSCQLPQPISLSSVNSVCNRALGAVHKTTMSVHISSFNSIIGNNFTVITKCE